jgi:hypothetical protein
MDYLVHQIRDWDIRLASLERIRGSQRSYTSHGSGALISMLHSAHCDILKFLTLFCLTDLNFNAGYRPKWG